MKVFISIPMSGRTDKEVFDEIEEIKKIFTDYIKDTQPGTEIEFINTYVQPQAPEDCVTEPLWYLGESIKVLSTCDAVIFAPGFRQARGCTVEYLIALNYYLDFYEMETDDTKVYIQHSGEYTFRWEKEY